MKGDAAPASLGSGDTVHCQVIDLSSEQSYTHMHGASGVNGDEGNFVGEPQKRDGEM